MRIAPDARIKVSAFFDLAAIAGVDAALTAELFFRARWSNRGEAIDEIVFDSATGKATARVFGLIANRDYLLSFRLAAGDSIFVRNIDLECRYSAADGVFTAAGDAAGGGDDGGGDGGNPPDPAQARTLFYGRGAGDTPDSLAGLQAVEFAAVGDEKTLDIAEADTDNYVIVIAPADSNFRIVDAAVGAEVYLVARANAVIAGAEYRVWSAVYLAAAVGEWIATRIE